MYALNNNITYFNTFGVELIPREIKEFIDNEIIITNILRIQTRDSVMCGYFCIRFVTFMLESKSLADFTNLFSPNDFSRK